MSSYAAKPGLETPKRVTLLLLASGGFTGLGNFGSGSAAFEDTLQDHRSMLRSNLDGWKEREKEGRKLSPATASNRRTEDLFLLPKGVYFGAVVA